MEAFFSAEDSAARSKAGQAAADMLFDKGKSEESITDFIKVCCNGIWIDPDTIFGKSHRYVHKSKKHLESPGTVKTTSLPPNAQTTHNYSKKTHNPSGFATVISNIIVAAFIIFTAVYFVPKACKGTIEVSRALAYSTAAFFLYVVYYRELEDDREKFRYSYMMILLSVALDLINPRGLRIDICVDIYIICIVIDIIFKEDWTAYLCTGASTAFSIMVMACVLPENILIAYGEHGVIITLVLLIFSIILDRNLRMRRLGYA